MAPKKVEEPEKKPLIGRVGTNLKVGIVGVPNVGKSTFFNVLTKSQAAAENFPFCTIDPNENKYLYIFIFIGTGSESICKSLFSCKYDIYVVQIIHIYSILPVKNCWH